MILFYPFILLIEFCKALLWIQESLMELSTELARTNGFNKPTRV